MPRRLAALLETLPSEERQEIAAWLFNGGTSTGSWFNSMWLGAPISTEQILPMGLASVSAAENTQLSTVRLPTESHAKLREWCSDHGFTMAAVIRGLVERFLEEQAKRPR